MKKSICLLYVFFSIISLNLVSAQFGNFGSFSLMDFIDSGIGFDNFVFMAVFLIFFAFLFFIFGKVFKSPTGEPNKAISGTISFAISALITYGMYKTGFDVASLLYQMGIEQEVLYPIIFLVIFIGLIYLMKKFGLGKALMLLGLLLILLTLLTDIIYEEGTVLIAGIIFLLIGLWLWGRKNKKEKMKGYGGSGYYSSPPNQKTNPRMFSRINQSRFMQRRREITEARHQQKVEYERQRAREMYKRKLGDKFNIAKKNNDIEAMKKIARELKELTG